MAKYNRYENQCVSCGCFYLNLKDQEVIDAVETECSHEYDCYSEVPCPLCLRVEEEIEEV
jgi:hypothetical protein